MANLVGLQVTANALRQQVMNREARRLEKEIKEVRQYCNPNIMDMLQVS